MATNPYYQRAFNALAGSLARARQMLNEFQLIQNGFDLIGNLERYTKYQLSCSDLTSDLEANPEAAYFRAQSALELVEIRASVAQASASGQVAVQIYVNDVALLSTLLTIDEGERSSATAAVAAVMAFTAIPDDAEFRIEIVGGGTAAKGLIVAIRGRIVT